MSKYDSKVHVTLTASQWLTAKCALHDAIRYNEDKDFPLTAQDFRSVLAAIGDQVDFVLAAAAAETEEYLKEEKA